MFTYTAYMSHAQNWTILSEFLPCPSLLASDTDARTTSAHQLFSPWPISKGLPATLLINLISAACTRSLVLSVMT